MFNLLETNITLEETSLQKPHPKTINHLKFPHNHQLEYKHLITKTLYKINHKILIEDICIGRAD